MENSNKLQLWLIAVGVLVVAIVDVLVVAIVDVLTYIAQNNGISLAPAYGTQQGTTTAPAPSLAAGEIAKLVCYCLCDSEKSGKTNVKWIPAVKGEDCTSHNGENCFVGSLDGKIIGCTKEPGWQ